MRHHSSPGLSLSLSLSVFVCPFYLSALSGRDVLEYSIKSGSLNEHSTLLRSQPLASAFIIVLRYVMVRTTLRPTAHEKGESSSPEKRPVDKTLFALNVRVLFLS